VTTGEYPLLYVFVIFCLRGGGFEADGYGVLVSWAIPQLIRDDRA
jgi:hypothetical protein